MLYEAVLCAPEAKAQKLVDVFKANRQLFAALAKDQPSQLAQLIALEHTIAGEDMGEREGATMWRLGARQGEGNGARLGAGKRLEHLSAPCILCICLGQGGTGCVACSALMATYSLLVTKAY